MATRVEICSTLLGDMEERVESIVYFIMLSTLLYKIPTKLQTKSLGQLQIMLIRRKNCLLHLTEKLNQKSYVLCVDIII